MTANEAPVLLILIPLLASFPCLLEKVLPKLRVAAQAGFGAVFLSLVVLAFSYGPVRDGTVSAYNVGGWAEGIGIALYLDGAAWLSSLMVLIVCLASLLYCSASGYYGSVFYALFLIMLSGMQGVLLTGDLFNMFVFFEILTLVSCVFIAYTGKKQALAASFRYLLVSSLGMVLFLLGILILYGRTGTLSLRLIAEGIRNGTGGIRSAGIAFSAIAAGIGVRIAFMPFHAWLIDAHAWAPHPVSAILSGIMIKVSFVSLWRIFTVLDPGNLRSAFIWIGAGTALVAVIGALSQSDGKKLLAWHSVSQMGFIVCGFGVGSALAVTAAFCHMISHAVFKSLLFLSVGTVIDASGERSVYKIRGAGRKLPFVYAAFLVGAFSISGVPFFNGFVTKGLVSAGLKDFPAAYPMIWLAGAGTAASFIKLSAIFGTGRKKRELPRDPSEEKDGEQAGETRTVSEGGGDAEGTTRDVSGRYRPVPGTAYLPLGMLSVLCVLTAVIPGFWISKAWELIHGRLREAIPGSYTATGILNSGATLLAGFVLYLLVRSRHGAALSARIRAIAPDMTASLMMLVAGFAGLTLVTVFMP